LAVFYTGGLFTFLMSVDTEITEVSWKGQIVNGNLRMGLVFILCHFNAVFSSREIVFLLAGHLTGMTARAIIIIYQQSIFPHL
jgi:hypothetical protein